MAMADKLKLNLDKIEVLRVSGGCDPGLRASPILDGVALPSEEQVHILGCALRSKPNCWICKRQLWPGVVALINSERYRSPS